VGNRAPRIHAGSPLYGASKTCSTTAATTARAGSTPRPSSACRTTFPIAGYGTQTVNLLRLWASKATEDFDLAAFNSGGYVEAVREKAVGRDRLQGALPERQNRERQGAAPRAAVFFRRLLAARHHPPPLPLPREQDWANFSDKVAVQLNDTHPAIAVVELMRILIDEENMAWDEAWAIVTSKHLCLHESHPAARGAGEVERGTLFERVLPRHLQIIYEINTRVMATVEAKWPGDNEKKRICSLIEESGHKMVRMANLAVVGSHTVNGVAALHTVLLKKDLFPEFDALYPGKFQNKTNGITPRRWLLKSNPRLSSSSREARQRSVGRAISTSPARTRKIRRRRRVPARVHGDQARQQGRPRRGHQASAASRCRPMRSSTCRSSVCTNTSASI
jgi:glycogen/starch/alpha-glucan phosphorylase-like protein